MLLAAYRAQKLAYMVATSGASTLRTPDDYAGPFCSVVVLPRACGTTKAHLQASWWPRVCHRRSTPSAPALYRQIREHLVQVRAPSHRPRAAQEHRRPAQGSDGLPFYAVYPRIYKDITKAGQSSEARRNRRAGRRHGAPASFSFHALPHEHLRLHRSPPAADDPGIIGITLVAFIVSHAVPADPDHLQSGTARPGRPKRCGDAIATSGVSISRCPFNTSSIVWNMLHGDLGVSITTRRPVTTIFASTFRRPSNSSTAAIIFSVLIGIPLGVLAAVHRNRPPTISLACISLIGISTPVFWLGLSGAHRFLPNLGVVSWRRTDRCGHYSRPAHHHGHAGRWIA